MRLEKNVYPYNPQAKELPFFLSGIGGSKYQQHISRPFGYRWHQILFCANDSGIFEFDETKVKINPGNYFFIPKDYPHSYYSDDKFWDVRWIAFEGSSCDDVLSQFGMTKPIVISPTEETRLEKTFDKMIISLETDVLYCDYTCSGLVYDYIIEFHRFMETNADSKKSRQLSMLLPVLRFMQENFRKDISMTELSEMIGITPQHFCRVFKKAMDMSPNEFLTKLRIDEAKRLMCDSRLSVTQAGERSGFRDASYFSTVFKKHESVSPSEYIKIHMGNSR